MVSSHIHNEKVQILRIVIRADKNHQHYLRTLPIHDSQKEIFTCEEYADFELYLRPTYDFCMEHLRHSDSIGQTVPS